MDSVVVADEVTVLGEGATAHSTAELVACRVCAHMFRVVHLAGEHDVAAFTAEGLVIHMTQPVGIYVTLHCKPANKD